MFIICKNKTIVIMMDKIQKFGIVSLIIFSVIIGLAVILYTNCILSVNCSNQIYLSHFLHVSLIMAGLIGSIYAVFMLKGLDKTEISIEKDIKELIKDDPDINKDNNGKIICF